MKSSRGMLILVLVFIALLVLVMLSSERVGTPTPDSDLPAIATPESLISDADILNQMREINRIFPDMLSESIVALNLVDPVSGISLTLTRVDDGWEAVETGATVDPELGFILSETIAILPYLSVFDGVEPEQYPDFGLSPADALLFINFIMDNGTTHAIAIGDLSPDETGHYALVDDRMEMYLIERAPIAYFAVILQQIQNTG